MSTESMEKQKDLLKRYLGKYYRARMKERQLEARLRSLRESIGVKGIDYSPTPKSQTNNVGSGAESEVLRIMEIEDRIEKQREEARAMMNDVMDIMDLLPVDSTERTIIEYRHLDCMNWKQICREMHMARTPCTNYYNAGIERLLTFPAVCETVEKFARNKDLNRLTSE